MRNSTGKFSVGFVLGGLFGGLDGLLGSSPDGLLCEEEPGCFDNEEINFCY